MKWKRFQRRLSILSVKKMDHLNITILVFHDNSGSNNKGYFFLFWRQEARKKRFRNFSFSWGLGRMYLFKTLPLVCTYPSYFIVFFLITITRCMLLFFQSHILYKVTSNPIPDSCLILILLTFDSLNMSISLTIKKLVTFVLEIHLWFYF